MNVSTLSMSLAWSVRKGAEAAISAHTEVSLTLSNEAHKLQSPQMLDQNLKTQRNNNI